MPLPVLYTPAVIRAGVLRFGDCDCVCVPSFTFRLSDVFGSPSTSGGLLEDSVARFAWYERTLPNPWHETQEEVSGKTGATSTATLGGLRKKNPCGVPVDVTNATASVQAASGGFSWEQVQAHILGVQSGGWAFTATICISLSFSAETDPRTVTRAFRVTGRTNSCAKYLLDYGAASAETSAQPVIPVDGTQTFNPNATQEFTFTATANIPAYDPTGPDEQRYTRYFWARAQFYLDPNYDQGLVNP